MKIIRIGFIDKGSGDYNQSNTVYSPYGVAPTVCHSFGYKQPPTMILIKDEKSICSEIREK